MILARKLNTRPAVTVWMDVSTGDSVWVGGADTNRCCGKCKWVPIPVLFWELLRSLFFSSVKWQYQTRSASSRVCSLEQFIYFLHSYPYSRLHRNDQSVVKFIWKQSSVPVYLVNVQKGSLLFSISQNYGPTKLSSGLEGKKYVTSSIPYLP